jgi:hypothetical protein
MDGSLHSWCWLLLQFSQHQSCWSTLPCFPWQRRTVRPPLQQVKSQVEIANSNDTDEWRRFYRKHSHCCILYKRELRVFFVQVSILCWTGWRCREKLAVPYKVGVKKSWIDAIISGVGEGSMFACYALVFWYGGQLIHSKELTFLEVMKGAIPVIPSVLTTCSVFMGVVMRYSNCKRDSRSCQCHVGWTSRCPYVDGSENLWQCF